MKLVYIPGFNSNGDNNYFSTNFGAEVINYDPTSPTFVDDTINIVSEMVSKYTNVKVIGNSLGGWLAIKVCAALDIPVFLINPLVNPENMVKLIGTQTNFDTGITYEWETSHVNTMIKIEDRFKTTIMELNLIFCSLSINDMLIDYKDLENKYNILPTNVMYLTGGHRIDDSEKHTIINSGVFKRFLDFRIG